MIPFSCAPSLPYNLIDEYSIPFSGALMVLQAEYFMTPMFPTPEYYSWYAMVLCSTRVDTSYFIDTCYLF